MRANNYLKYFCLLSLVVFMCVGCDIIYADTTRDIRHAGFNLSGSEIECAELFDTQVSEKLKFLTGSHFVMSSGSVYSLSVGQKYSNEQHCKQVPISSNVTAIFDDNVVRTSDGKYYFLVASGDSKAYSEVPTNDNNYPIYNVLLKDTEVVKVKTADSNLGHYYVLKKDGNVYNYIVSKNNESASITGNSVVYSKSNYGGSIIDFNYVGKTLGTFIRTNTEIFRMLAVNREECSKYADISCIYEMRLDTQLTEHQDKILGFSGTYLITDYGKQFNAVA